MGNILVLVLFLLTTLPTVSFAAAKPSAVTQKTPILEKLPKTDQSEKPAILQEDCREPFMTTDQNGQTYPSIIYTDDGKGNCEHHVIFDPNQETSTMALQDSGVPLLNLPQTDYLSLAIHYAPAWYQDVDDDDTRAEYITNFNYD